MINIALNKTSSYIKKEKLILVFYISHHKLLLKHAEHYNHCISTLTGCIFNISLFIFAFKSAAALLIGKFSSENPPPIMISYCLPWCSHQPMNGI